MKIDTGWFQVAMIVGITWGFVAALGRSFYKLLK